MLRLSDIMTRDVITVSPDLSLRDAMELFAHRHISGAPVVVGDRIVGVVSLSDLAELASGSPGVPMQRPDFVDIGELESPADFAEDEPPATFFAEMWEDAGADLTERFKRTEGPEWNALEALTVGEAMNRKVAALAPSTPVHSAAAVMQRAGIHRVLVMEDHRLLGVVSTKDISDAVAHHGLSRNVYVFGKRADALGSRNP